MAFSRDLRPALLIVPVLTVLAVASAILFQSLENDRQVERARQERFMRNAAFSVVDDLGSELFTMYSAFSYDLSVQRSGGAPVTRDTLTAAVSRYRAQARFPDLLQTLVCLAASKTGSYDYSRWTDQGWIADSRPDWAADLVVPSSDGPRGTRGNRAAFSLEQPVLTVALPSTHPVPGEVVAVALRFSTQVVLEQIVPTLVRQRFSDSQQELPYRASVHNRALDDTDHGLPVDWEVPLLPWTPFDSWFDYYVNRLQTMDRSRLAFERVSARGNEPDGTGWALTVARLPRGLDDEMAWYGLRNVALSLGFFVFLSLAFLGFYGAARRARNLSQQERAFLALISHELKTPLAVVRSLAENLTRGIGADEARARQYGEVLLEESDRLSRMIGNVLGLTSIQGGVAASDRVPVDLEALVRERLARQEPAPGVTLEVRIHPGLPQVQGHPMALAAAVDNLVGNAFRHGVTGQGPHRIEIWVEPKSRWRVRGVELRIQDNGPGFTWSEGRAFVRPFRRGRHAQAAQTPGSGVGLSLVLATAQALGGRLTWQARPGRGARFCLWLREAKG
jgi:signal transduction histidine kinase